MKYERIRESIFLRVLVAVVGSALVTLAILVITVAPVSSYYLWGPHYDADSINPISYRFISVHSEYELAFKNAESAWDATSAPGYFQEHSWSWDPEVNVIDGSFYGTDWARCSGTTDGDMSWSGNEVEIEFDTVDMAWMNAYQKKIVAEHELGHAYGLWHNYECYVMAQGIYKFTCGSMPTSDDVAGVEAIY